MILAAGAAVALVLTFSGAGATVSAFMAHGELLGRGHDAGRIAQLKLRDAEFVGDEARNAQGREKLHLLAESTEGAAQALAARKRSDALLARAEKAAPYKTYAIAFTIVMAIGSVLLLRTWGAAREPVVEALSAA